MTTNRVSLSPEANLKSSPFGARTTREDEQCSGDVSSSQEQTDGQSSVENPKECLEKESKPDVKLLHTNAYDLDPNSCQRAPSPITVRVLSKHHTFPQDFHTQFQKMKHEKRPNVETDDNNVNGSESQKDLVSETMKVERFDNVESPQPKQQNTHNASKLLDESNSDQVLTYDPSDEALVKQTDTPHRQESLLGDVSSKTDSPPTVTESNTPSPSRDRLLGFSGDNLCIECVKPIQVTHKTDVNSGDHITFSGKIYDHHAIVVQVYELYESSEDVICVQIVHATNTSAKATLASLHPFGNKARLRKVEELINFRERKVFVYKYNSLMDVFSPQTIVERALNEAKADLAGGKGKFIYDLFRNNCEHFATWCVTGHKLSLQERKFTMVFWMFLGSGFRGISDENQRNEKEYEYKMLCNACYGRNKKVLDVHKKKIVDAGDIQKGDIITYSYYNLWHDAVVLEIVNTSFSNVRCKISHYAFCYFGHRTIKEEELSIPLDGSVTVNQYTEQFDIYSPDEVVERARKRLGEQQFAFFSNDSSQYSRWCKLKLQKQDKDK